jgi:hypothetical protein
MSWQVSAAHTPGSTTTDLFDGGFSWGLLLIGTVALLALTAVCTFGILARMRDRAADQKSLAALHHAAQDKDQPANQDSGQAQKSSGSGSSPD